MEFLVEYGLFFAKAVTILVVIAVILALIASSKQRVNNQNKGHIEVKKLNETYDEYTDTLKEVVFDDSDLKQQQKDEKKQQKLERKAQKKAQEQGDKARRKRVYVLNFDGDIKASANGSLREEITAVLGLAEPQDEVVVRLESGGGMVHGYGLAASQLTRITEKSIPLTVCVDKVAASGGYMMACVANKIVAAPFAIVGSIGVVAQLPNFHRLLKKNDIDFELYTAGEFKRTVTMFGENTDKGRAKFLEDIEQTHDLFKDYVQEHRPVVDIAKVATGEVWYGRRALEEKLIDELKTSDGYLLEQAQEADVFSVEFTHKKSLPEKLGFAAESTIDRLALRWLGRLQASRWF
ncbi:protease SohB [Gilvimarinus sp. SDUM040013]|uniref:Protease SohB n=1 Tax=Gilvimarinus gilvus TaxID=3058038 RepID=A0ABU4RWT1_9GAMM|nr:protease SohB [Gilvimarinus sp. SDUM040013]MDO3385684.1 protease SohB [Gilvimarinus sp. SDUM040013]MDX6849322.1 protease SohB [Gilvimarinus sp. SDUM040013]